MNVNGFGSVHRASRTGRSWKCECNAVIDDGWKEIQFQNDFAWFAGIRVFVNGRNLEPDFFTLLLEHPGGSINPALVDVCVGEWQRDCDIGGWFGDDCFDDGVHGVAVVGILNRVVCLLQKQHWGWRCG